MRRKKPFPRVFLSPSLRVRWFTLPLGVIMGKTRWTALCLVAFLTACTTPGVKAVPVSSTGISGSQTEVPVGIPREYIPPPGNCRVWYPDRSPDEQPQPERCLEIPEVPVGAWLVYGGAVVKTYRIEENDLLHPGTVKYMNYFELESGRFLRREKVCP